MLSEDDIQRIATGFFGCKIWEEMDEKIQEPYGYLALTRNGRNRHIFRLTQKEHIIGRDAATCSLLLPQRFESVSRNHALIQQEGDHVYLQDLESSNGTFVNNKQLNKKERFLLHENQQIRLGDFQCELSFSKTPFMNESGEPGVTKPAVYEAIQMEEVNNGEAEEQNSRKSKRFWQNIFPRK